MTATPTRNKSGHLPADKLTMRRCYRLGQVAFQNHERDTANPFEDLRQGRGKITHHPAYRLAWYLGWMTERDNERALKFPGYNTSLWIEYPPDLKTPSRWSTTNDEYARKTREV